MKVSIIIPIYNVSDYVERCLQSVMKQNYQDIECILVDDNTPDDSIEKCQRMIDEYNGPIQFKISHHKHNRGLSAARNTGMNAANGEYIYFLDSDDYIFPNCIKCLVEAINKEDGIDWAWGKFDDDSNIHPNIPCGVYSNDMVLMKQFIRDPMAYNRLYKNNFIKRSNLRFKEGLIHEDDLWSFMVACHTRRISICEDLTYHYYHNPNGIMAQPLSIRYSHYCRVYSEMIHYAKENKLWCDKYIYEYINKQIKRIYQIPFYFKEPNLSYVFYMMLRRERFWNIFQIWVMSKSWKRCIIHFHRLMPSKVGYKLFHYVLSSCL